MLVYRPTGVHCTLYTEQCTVYSLHSTVYTVHCTLYPVHCTMYPIHCRMYTLHSTVYTVHCTLYTVHCTLYTVQFTCTLDLMQEQSYLEEAPQLHLEEPRGHAPLRYRNVHYCMVLYSTVQ